MMYRVAIYIALACAALLPACGAKSSVACPPLLSPVAIFWDYPVSGASAVPLGPQTFVFGTNAGPLVSGLELVLTPLSGPPIVSSALAPVPSPVPTPHASLPPGIPLVGFSIPTLAKRMTYQVTFQAIAQTPTGCVPPYQVIFISGNFETSYY